MTENKKTPQERLINMYQRIEAIRIRIAYEQDHGVTDETMTGFLAGLEATIQDIVEQMANEPRRDKPVYTDRQIESHIAAAGRSTGKGEYATAEAVTALAMIFHNQSKKGK